MAEKENPSEPKDMIEVTPEEMDKLEASEEVEEIKEMSFQEKRAEREKRDKEENLTSWVPKTQIGRDVKSGKEKDIDNILDNEKKILEPEIVDKLIHVETDLISIGQAKGKFGGGKRRAWRQTQKKTKEGNVLTFSAMAVVGDKKGHVGLGYGKAKETLPSREKAIRKAKISLIRINRGCSHFDCSCGEPHTIPYKIEGKCGSVKVTLIPAPQGTGLVIGDEGKKILKLAGITDVYSKTKGHVRTTFNFARALINALEKTREMER